MSKGKLYAIGIVWDTDGEKVKLPKQVFLPIGICECRCSDWLECEENSESVNEYLSNKYGWCVENYSLVIKK